MHKKETETFPFDTVLPVKAPRARCAARCNDLDGGTWLRYSISVWDDIRKSDEEARGNHPAAFPSMLVKRLIDMFLRKSQKVVLDPFVGSGSTVVAAMQAGKLGIGLDICAAYIERARIRADGLRTLWHDEAPLPDPILRVADARNLLAYVEPSSVDLCITSPPYWDILTQKRSADYKPVRNYGDLADDLGRIQNYRAFLDELIAVFHQVFVALRPNCHCVVVVMDIRKKNQFYPFHADVADFMMKIGFIYDDLIIWNRKAEYNNLRPLGYPSVFRVNKIHEFILLFKTPASREKCKIDWKILEQASAHASKGGIAAQRP